MSFGTAAGSRSIDDRKEIQGESDSLPVELFQKIQEGDKTFSLILFVGVGYLAVMILFMMAGCLAVRILDEKGNSQRYLPGKT